MQIIELALVLLLITAIGGALVRWTSLGLPIFLVVVGAVASFIPGLDHMAIDPEVFLLLFIPPLLFADAALTQTEIALQQGCTPDPAALNTRANLISRIQRKC